MNAPLPIRSALLLLIALVSTSPSLTFAARAPQLRYHFDEALTNIYSVQIETRGESGTDILSGNLTVATRSVATNIRALSFRGSLIPHRDATSRPPSLMLGSGLSRMPMPVTIYDGCEVQFDDLGQIVRIAGDYPLALPLGTICQLFVETLPLKNSERWDTSETLAIMDEPLVLGPAASFTAGYGISYYSGPFMGRNGPALLPVTRKCHYEIKSADAQATILAKKVSVETRLLFGKEPRLSATGDGEIIFDSTGLLRRSDFEYKTASNAETVTRRTTLSLHIKLLEGAEREAALKPPPVQSSQTPAGKKLTSEEIQTAMTDLKSDDSAKRSAAAGKLTSADLSDVPSGLLELMVTCLSDNDSTVRNAAIRVIADYGTTEQVPELLKFLKDSESSYNQAVFRGLGRLKDKRAAEPLAAIVASGSGQTQSAANALSKIGPDAEDAVLPLLKEKNNETRKQGCNILKQIGTRKSLEPLRELTFDPDRSVSEAATEAGRAIMTRL